MAITKHTVADNATVLNIDGQVGLVPVAVYAAAWVPATATFGVRLGDAGAAALGDTAPTYKATDSSAITLTDDKWCAIPEAAGRLLVDVDWQLIFNTAETGGPFTVQILWAPTGGA